MAPWATRNVSRARTRLNLAVDVEQQRHAADDAVVVRQPVEKPEPGRRVGQNGNGNESAVEAVEEWRRRIADEGKARFRREARLRAVVRRGEEDAEHDRAVCDRVRESDVGVGTFLAMRRIVGAMDGALGAGLHITPGPLLFGKQHVEPDCGDVGLGQRLDKLRHRLTRPWPPANEMEGLVVDVDDADGLIEIVGPRTPALVLIEDEIFQIAAHRREQGAKGERQDIGAHHHQHIRPPLPQGLCRPRLHRTDDRI